MYPKICTHRDDKSSQVVVANAEQESALPPEYRSQVTDSAIGISAVDHAADVMLSPEYADVLNEREALEKDRREFADLVAGSQKEIADATKKLADDRADLTAGYKASMVKLEADRAKLNDDISKFTNYLSAEAESTDPSPTNDAPAKRVRVAKASE